MITLYGSAHSRASRSLLVLEELALDYRHVPLAPWNEPADGETLARLNPNARVPVLDDDGRVLWESMAINLYLGDRYGAAPFWPPTPDERAHLYQWLLWSQTEIDVRARHRARFSDDVATQERARAERLTVLARLDAALASRTWVLGDEYTLADASLATTLCEPWEKGRVDGELDPADHGLGALADWLRRCTERPAWHRIELLP